MFGSGTSAMQAEWLVAKYVQDLRRQEPKNVGVVLKVGDLFLSRFLGERDEGQIDGRTVRGLVSSVDNYKAWVAHWQHTTSRGRGDFDVFTKRRGDDSYYLEYGGERLFGSEETEPEDMLDYLYGVLVEEAPEPKTLNVRQLSERVLDHAGILDKVTSEYHLPLRLGGGNTDRAYFDYRYDNGAVHLMKRITLTYEGERSWERVHAAAWDFEKAALNPDNSGQGLIALVKTRPFDPDLETQIGVLSNLAFVVNVAQVDEAASKLTQLLHLDGNPALR